MPITTIFIRWRQQITASPLRQLAHTVAIAATTSIATKSVAFAKELVIASHFGLAGALDVYLVAFVLIGAPLSILINAAQTTFIAQTARSSKNQNDDASILLSTSLLVLLGLAILLAIWLWALPYAIPFLAPGFTDEKRITLQIALHWLTPYYFLAGFSFLGYGALQARGRYISNGLLPIATPLVTTLIIFAWGTAGEWKTLIAALTIGTTLESLLLLATINRHSNICRAQLDFSGAARIMLASLPLLPGSIMLTTGPVIEQAIATSMGEGSNAALSYGYKLPAAIQSVAVTAIGITALPYFAKQLGKGEIHYCLHSLKKLSLWLFSGGCGLALLFSFFSTDIIEILYQRGAFDQTATIRVSPIQLAYFIQFPFALIAMLSIKALAALQLNWLTSFYTTIAVVLQTTLAFWLSNSIGTPGIAWSATISTGLMAAILLVNAHQSIAKLANRCP